MMEFGPIFRALINNRTRFWLITLEVAMTLAVVVNCSSIFLDKRSQFMAPTGIDIDNILVVEALPYGDAYADEAFIDDVRTRDLTAIRNHAGVVDATISSHVPLSGSGSAAGRKALGSELDTVAAPYFVVDEHGINAFGVQLLEGRNFTPDDIHSGTDSDNNDMPRNVIITQDFATEFFGDEPAVGKQLTTKNEEVTETVIGVIGNMSNSWPRSSIGRRTMLRPGRAGNRIEMNYIIRCQPGVIDSLYTEIGDLFVDLEPSRIIEVSSLSEIKQRNFRRTLMAMKIWAAVIVLMLIVTSLGIVGLTSFSVTQRIREIGTRRALGATRFGILRYFLVENWLITGIGLTLGVGLTIGLNFGLARFDEAPRIDWMLIAGGALLLSVAGQIAAFVPAARATTVAPEIATRTV